MTTSFLTPSAAAVVAGAAATDSAHPSSSATPSTDTSSISIPLPESAPAGVDVDTGHLHPQTDDTLDQSAQQPELPPTSSSHFFSPSSSRLPAQPPFPEHPSTATTTTTNNNNHRNGNPTSTILSFADIPSDLALLQIDPQPQQQLRPTNTGLGAERIQPTASLASAPSSGPFQPPPFSTQPQAQVLTPSPSPSPSPSRPSRHVGLISAPNSVSPSNGRGSDHTEPARQHLSSISPSPASGPVHHPQPRKPSPGLAARLKALGFGTAARRDTSPPQPQPQLSSTHHPDRVGRLPEDQIRQIDQKHQAGSSTLVIERRGRPWKGAGAAVARLPSSVASLASGRARHDPDAGADADIDADSYTDASVDRRQHADTTFLPEIEPSLPLDMDTNKYRLPDHTNGNGTKVQLDTRQQHIERDHRSSSAASLRISSPDIPPPPLRKDTPPPPFSQQQERQQPVPSSAASSQTEFNPDAISYFNPLGLQRPGSIYTLSRLSFANQLAQLTSIQLPDAESLSSKVSAIPTAQAAARALIGAAEQIRNWISKASEVISGLDSDDDVEWAAAGGREGLEEVENAILRFEELINVYVGAIEELQGRSDIAHVTPEDLQRAVVQMEFIMDEWRKMRNTLHSVKAQVEIAMEWEELWSMVLGDIQNEMDELSRLVFEMEERRHRSMARGGAGGEGAGVDIGDLETIVEETQQQQQQPPNSAATRAAAGGNRYSIPIFPVSPMSPDAQARSTTPTISQDDSSLLALFARMQPLRASLDFLPMRLSVFETRASSCFPTACEELEMRRAGLDASYQKLEKDAESLRKELGEDRWVAVFRGAARQAQKMYESVERSVTKLKEGLDAGMQLTNQPLISKKLESYDNKKTHYGPAIERVLSIIDKGIKDRLTLNGEILRLHAELQAQWDGLKERMHDLDMALEELHADDKRNQQLRDSISSMLSNDRSTVGSAHETPQSSPPSSVIMSSLGFEGGGGSAKRLAAGNAALDNNKTTPTNNRRRSLMGSHLPQPANRRSFSSSPAVGGPGSSQMRKPLSRFSTSLGPTSTTGSGLSSPSRDGSVTPVGKRFSALPPRSSAVPDGRPRWNTSTTGVDTGHNFKPLSLTTPSPYAKTPPSMRRSASSTVHTPGSVSSITSKLPMRSPLGRAQSSSPIPDDASLRRLSDSRDTPPYRPSRLVTKTSTTGASNNRRASMQPPRLSESTSGAAPRPASSLATSRRTSMLPTPRQREGSVSGSVSGRASPQALAGARFAMRKKSAEPKLNDKPKWRV
ncbi:Karyogamy protein, KAR9 [Niveomyces insectorum RCEF 264]|uniref:Karyogamy protein, KAR9 n=1 Tax=Niveomyces insectorum RCEF 264 TaxID=1081102 RepID=A0A162J246_9HYPO|nr:Karyogamy protein, KAR9 [Niveomyces insectorum RCEF 264]